jgi:DNA-binding FrmR family transcriptional regulator
MLRLLGTRSAGQIEGVHAEIEQAQDCTESTAVLCARVQSDNGAAVCRALIAILSQRLARNIWNQTSDESQVG